jgi:hypothetical protein
MHHKTFSVIVLFLLASHSQAEKRFIDPVNGNDAFTGSSETQAWRTIPKANRTLIAGDTVFIKAGTYNCFISPENSGTAAQPIAYMNFNADKVVISDTMFAVNLDGKSHIVIQGLAMRRCDRFLYVRNNSNYNTIAWCSFDSARMTNGQTATWAGSVISGSSQHNWVHHCRFSNYGYFTDDDISCILDIGSEEGKTDSTCFNLIENSQFYHGGHHVMGVYGKFNVIRNNWFHNEPWSMGTAASDRGAVLYGDRNLSFSGYSENGGRTLFEGNKVSYSSDPSDNIGASGMAMNSSENIVRFNTYFNNISAGLSMSLTESYIQNILRNKVYNNTFFNNGHNPYDSIDHMSSGIGFGIYSGALVIKDNVLKNNLLYKHKLTFGEYNINTADRTGIMALQVFSDNWDGDKKGDPKFVNAGIVPGNPMDSALPDLHLTAGSPCIDSGTFLTTIVSAAGSGLTFKIADAGYFTDGWGIPGVLGDEIQLFGTSQRARITTVNYATNTITLDRSLTWAENQGVCLAYEGAAPDIGAFEFGSKNPVIQSRAAAPRQNQLKIFGIYNLQGRKISVLMDAILKNKSAPTFGRTGVYFCVTSDKNGNTRVEKKIVGVK